MADVDISYSSALFLKNLSTLVFLLTFSRKFDEGYMKYWRKGCKADQDLHEMIGFEGYYGVGQIRESAHRKLKAT